MPDEKTEIPVPENGQDTEPQSTDQAAQTFYSYKYPDGKEEQFGTRASLDAAWRSSYLRTADYTRKTQEHATKVREFEKRQQEIAEREKALQESGRKFTQWDELLRSRPEIYRQLEAMSKNPASPGEIFDRTKQHVDERYKSLEDKLQQLEERYQSEAQRREMQETMDTLEQEYGEEFNRDAIQEGLAALNGADTPALLRMLHFASVGRRPKADMEQKVVEKIEQKRRAGVMPSSKGSPPRTDQTPPRSIREARDRALRDIGETRE